MATDHDNEGNFVACQRKSNAFIIRATRLFCALDKGKDI